MDKRPVVGSRGTTFTRHQTDREKQHAAIEEMFSKAKRLDFEDEDVVGISRTGNTDGGFNDDDWE